MTTAYRCGDVERAKRCASTSADFATNEELVQLLERSIYCEILTAYRRWAREQGQHVGNFSGEGQD